MLAVLTALDDVLAARWTRTSPWHTAGGRVQARGIDVVSGAPRCLTAVRWEADAIATAALAREIGALEILAHQPAALPIVGAGRHSGWLYMVTPCTEGQTLADVVRRDGALPAARVVESLIAIADLLHFMHGAGLAHTAISAATLCAIDGAVCLCGFGSTIRLAMVADPARHIDEDVVALAVTGCLLLTGTTDRQALSAPDADAVALAAVLARATSPEPAERFHTAIAFAQALCATRPALDVIEVSGRDAGDAADASLAEPLSDGAERSLSVLHAMLDRAEVEERPPEPDDPLVQRCWERAVAQVAPGDARLVALRVRWRLLADRDPAGALTASAPAQDAAAVWPYRARALAALGRAAEARTLAVRAWFDDVAMDVPALRSLTMALVLTRAFELASLVGVGDGISGLDDPVIRAAVHGDRSRGVSEPVRAIRAIAAAIDRRIPWTAELLVDPRWDALRGEPGFRQQVGRARAQWSA